MMSGEDKILKYDNPKSVVPRARSIPVNIRERRIGSDQPDYVERKNPISPIVDNVL